MTIETVCAKVALSKATVYAMVARDDFPAPRKAGRASRWIESEVDAWIKQRPIMGPSMGWPRKAA